MWLTEASGYLTMVNYMYTKKLLHSTLRSALFVFSGKNIITLVSACFCLAVSTMAVAANQGGGTGQPTPVEIVAHEPFQIDLGYTPFSGASVTESFGVPAGKRLVIEYVSGAAQLSAEAGVLGAFSIRTVASGVSVPHGLTYVDQGPGGPWVHRYEVAQMTRLYADPQTEVSIGVVTGLGGDGEFVARVSGYLVPVQN